MSRLAVEELAGWTGSHDRAAVIGCGAVGLATARLLQRRGAAVTIYARDLPPNITSNAAGGQWGPFSVSDPGQTTATFDKQSDVLLVRGSPAQRRDLHRNAATRAFTH